MKCYRRAFKFVLLCFIICFMPFNKNMVEASTSAQLYFTNDAPISIIPDFPTELGESNDENVEESLLPETGESISRMISLLGVTLVSLIGYLYKKNRKKDEIR